MVKTTKKRKKSKRLKRRIGLIAVGGLSFVLTICLSVGATLAWFAGSTWASNDLYMGGPVYVEMAGRGLNGVNPGANTPANGANDADWMGGAGTLDIIASARDTGTADFSDDFESKDKQSSILLPGQKLLIYSQARVYSTLEETTLEDGAYAGTSSGANNSNTNDGTKKYYNNQGRVQSTTTSVLRAKFSINIEFDPTVGINNFTDPKFAQGYPVQSTKYIGEYGTGATTEVGGGDVSSVNGTSALTWQSALGHSAYVLTNSIPDGGGDVTSSATGRRDAVANTALVEGAGKDYVANDYKFGTESDPRLNASVTPWVDGTGNFDMWQVKFGLSKSIYKWKYVSESVYTATAEEMRVKAPFNGEWNTAGGNSAKVNGGSGNGFYAVYESDGAGGKAESDAFYKARTNSYLKSYQEYYVDDYGRPLEMTISSSLETLETALNNSFIDLVSQSSDNIWAGNLMGFNAETDGRITYPSGAVGVGQTGATGIPASWLYVDPVVGNDTNSADSASSVGGWWYLVENVAANGNKSSGNNTIVTEIDNVVAVSKGTEDAPGRTEATELLADGTVKYDWGGTKNVANNTTPNIPADAYNDPIEGTGKAAPFQRLEDASKDASGTITETGVEFVGPKDKRILNAKLYEITPDIEDQIIATNPIDGTVTTKVVSYAFPFVNGNFELPGQALTNMFANAKISFQITFQALQAFFPFSQSIDSIPSGTAITGTGKALNIGNAIPIYNEAFDYLSWL